MSILSWRLDGYYDEAGNWRRTKFCFQSCGERCTCSPPGGRYYNEEYDEAKKKQNEQEGK